MTPLWSLSALLASVGLVVLGNGTLYTLLPMTMAAQGFSTSAVGTMVAAHAAGFLAGCFCAPSLIRRVGHIRVFGAFAAITAVASLAFAPMVGTVPWALLRLVVGFASAAMFTVIESWLNAGATRRDRGRVLGFYMIINRLGFALGQAGLALPGVGLVGFVMIASACYSLSVVPLAIGPSLSPAVPERRVVRLGRLWQMAPVAFLGCLVAGFVNSAVSGLAPVYAAAVGVPAELTAVLMAGMQLGGLLGQWPFARLSDHIDRRLVILGTSAGSGLVALLLAAGLMATPTAILAACAVWGGFSLSTYPLSIAHANDEADPVELVALSSSLLMVWSIGSVLGPLAIARAMDVLGAAQLFWIAAAGALLLSAAAAYSLLLAPPSRPLAPSRT